MTDGAYTDLPPAAVRALLPRVLAARWREREHAPSNREGLFIFESLTLRVFFSAGIEEDGKRWIHLSVSRADHAIPTWVDLVEVRDSFLGREGYAVQVLPPRSEHYTAPVPVEVAHLWSPLDGRPLPDFLRARGGTL